MTTNPDLGDLGGPLCWVFKGTETRPQQPYHKLDLKKRDRHYEIGHVRLIDSKEMEYLTGNNYLMMAKDNFSEVIDELRSSDSPVASVGTVLSKCEESLPLSPDSITQLGTLIEEVLKKLEANKKLKNDYIEWLMESYKSGVKLLETVCSRTGPKESRVAAFKTLIQLIPFYNDALHTKPMFPSEEYSAIVRLLVTSEGDISPLVPHLKELLSYEDMNKNLWKAIDMSIRMDRLPTVKELRRILHIIGLVEPSKTEDGPKLFYSRVKVGVMNAKQTDKCVRRLWERLSLVKVDDDVKQLLILALLEKMMSRMDRPIFLTDYFMESLARGGAVGVLSLQGIFELIQKYNINYPDVYGKLYSMFTPELFQTAYKSRFYYLADLFMSSTMLPEALVAGFAKRLARLTLVAPPPDIIILMAFITNLIIRHKNLKVLLSRPGSTNVACDPYLPEEENPSESRALESCLWELKLLQDHVLPTVANAALFINQDLPIIEKDLSAFLDNTTQLIFEKEMKIRVTEPPLSFERPTSSFTNKPVICQALSAWE